MYTEQEYLYGWLFYGAGAVLIWGAGFVLTGRIAWWRVRLVLLVALAALLAVPWYSGDDSRYLAPAWVIAGLEALFDGPEAFWRAGRPLLAGVGLAVVLTSLGLAVAWLLGRRAAATAAADQSEA